MGDNMEGSCWYSPSATEQVELKFAKGASGEESFKCCICKKTSLGISPDYFIGTKEGHGFHYACMKSIVEAGGEAKCPICNEKIGFDMLTKRIEAMEAERLSVPQKPPRVEPMCNIKFVVLGDSGVGKSSLLRAYVHGRGETGKLKTTVGLDMLGKVVLIGDQVIRLSLWDTAGQERCSAIVPNYLRNAQAILFVYSVTDMVSYQRVHDTWIPFAKDYGPENAIRVLIGNKCDQEGQRQVSTNVAKQYSVSQKMTFFETSATERFNIEPAIRTAIVEALEKVPLDQGAEPKKNTLRLADERKKKKPEKSGGCC